jgi:hypothetical protein
MPSEAQLFIHSVKFSLTIPARLDAPRRLLKKSLPVFESYCSFLCTAQTFRRLRIE